MAQFLCSAAAAGTAILSASHTTVLIGEAVHFLGSGVGLSYTSRPKEQSCIWSFDDAGAGFTVGSGKTNDANISRTPRAVKAWSTTGVKTVNFTERDANGNVSTGTIDITVVDPGTLTHDRDIYVSFAGNFTGFPAAGGAVEHISTIAAWDALSFSAANQEVRITLRDDENFAWTSSATWKLFDGNGSRYHIRRSGAGTNAPNIITPATDHQVFRPNLEADGLRFVVDGVDMDGGYDPVTADSPHGRPIFVSSTPPNAATSAYISLFRCNVTGGALYEGQGADSATNGPTYRAAVDCFCADWPNYAFASFGGRNVVGLFGNDFQHNPLTILRDGKIGGIEAADHGAVRLGCNLHCSVQNNKLAGAAGWTLLGGDYAVQQGLRVHPTTHQDAWTAYAADNIMASAWQTMHITDVTSGNGVLVQGEWVVSHNVFRLGRQSQGALAVDNANGAFLNNVVQIADVGRNVTIKQNWFVSLEDPTDALANNIDTGDVYIGFNNLVTHDDATIEVAHVWAGNATTVTEEANLVYGPNASNAGSFTDYTPLSPLDSFQPVTGSAAIDAKTTGFIPYDDFDGTVRPATANIGAVEGSVGSASNPTAPANTVAPTLALLSNFPNEYALTDLGTWTGDFDAFWIEFEINLNGTPTADSYRNVFDNTGGAGAGQTLTFEITAVDAAGNRATAASNGIAL